MRSAGCDYWHDGARCHRVPARDYINGRRCDQHSPATLAGRTVPTPDPDLTLDALRERARRHRQETSP